MLRGAEAEQERPFVLPGPQGDLAFSQIDYWCVDSCASR
jgi:hypothetical protein